MWPKSPKGHKSGKKEKKKPTLNQKLMSQFSLVSYDNPLTLWVWVDPAMVMIISFLLVSTIIIASGFGLFTIHLTLQNVNTCVFCLLLWFFSPEVPFWHRMHHMVKIPQLCFIYPTMANGPWLGLSLGHYQVFSTLQIVLLGRIHHIPEILYGLLFAGDLWPWSWKCC